MFELVECFPAPAWSAETFDGATSWRMQENHLIEHSEFKDQGRLKWSSIIKLMDQKQELDRNSLSTQLNGLDQTKVNPNSHDATMMPRNEVNRQPHMNIIKRLGTEVPNQQFC